jgi:predicted transcriptional regulator
MPEAKIIHPSLVAQIVRGYVAQNTIAAGELPNLIATIHRSLAGLDMPAETPAPKSAVAINRSYGRTFVACLECGWRGQILRRHLSVSHGLSPSAYRTRWNLKKTHPITAPAYSERRTAMAKQFGLGRLRASPETPPTAPPKRRGRPRTSAQPRTS